nr:Chain B, C-terminal tail of Transcription initiation factor TFIID subunit 2 [Saccharomyces]7UHE_D Chain D, C-terminal tail of Transcription initiation factor TFIID subunit 2 [Saccharomyces]
SRSFMVKIRTKN